MNASREATLGAMGAAMTAAPARASSAETKKTTELSLDGCRNIDSAGRESRSSPAVTSDLLGQDLSGVTVW